MLRGALLYLATRNGFNCANEAKIRRNTIVQMLKANVPSPSTFIVQIDRMWMAR